METQILGIPVLEKNQDTFSKATTPSSSCCSPVQPQTVCCTPSQTKDENDGACCAQPADGTACCNK